jgi:F-type H+-transporting ATPase subunit b
MMNMTHALVRKTGLTLTALLFVSFAFTSTTVRAEDYLPQDSAAIVSPLHKQAIPAENTPLHSVDSQKKKNGGLPQLNPQSYPSQIFWTLTLVLTLYIFFSRKTLPSIESLKNERHEKINGLLVSAEKNRVAAEMFLAQSNDTLASSRSLSHDTLSDAIKQVKLNVEEQTRLWARRFETEIEKKSEFFEETRKEVFSEIIPVAAGIAKEVVSRIANIDVSIDEATATLPKQSRAAAA